MSASSGLFTIGGESKSPGDQKSGFAGDIAEFLVFKSALSEPSLRAVEDYLAEKYAIRLSPADRVPEFCAQMLKEYV